MNLQDKLDNMRREFEADAPAETLVIMHRSTEDLANSGIMDGVLGTGEVAPHFTLSDQNGNDVNSEKLLARGPLVLSFYRGVW